MIFPPDDEHPEYARLWNSYEQHKLVSVRFHMKNFRCFTVDAVGSPNLVSFPFHTMNSSWKWYNRIFKYHQKTVPAAIDFDNLEQWTRRKLTKSAGIFLKYAPDTRKYLGLDYSEASLLYFRADDGLSFFLKSYDDKLNSYGSASVTSGRTITIDNIFDDGIPNQYFVDNPTFNRKYYFTYEIEFRTLWKHFQLEPSDYTAPAPTQWATQDMDSL